MKHGWLNTSAWLIARNRQIGAHVWLDDEWCWAKVTGIQHGAMVNVTDHSPVTLQFDHGVWAKHDAAERYEVRGEGQCETILRDGPCVMEANHRGRHTSVGFFCDNCGKVRRGQPCQSDEIDVCWFCVNVTGPSWRRGADYDYMEGEPVDYQPQTALEQAVEA